VEDCGGVSDGHSDFITAHSMLDEQLSAFLVIPFMIWDNLVGIATRYRLDSPGIQFQWR
jgi:hypothetical protein